MKTKLVTKDYLIEQLSKDPNLLIGRALTAIFHEQEYEEKKSDKTTLKNGRGFSANDARIGSLAAKAFLETGVVPQWLINVWSMRTKTGYPMICKYAEQLNEIALTKRNCN